MQHLSTFWHCNDCHELQPVARGSDQFRQKCWPHARYCEREWWGRRVLKSETVRGGHKGGGDRPPPPLSLELCEFCTFFFGFAPFYLSFVPFFLSFVPFFLRFVPVSWDLFLISESFVLKKSPLWPPLETVQINNYDSTINCFIYLNLRCFLGIKTIE